MYNESITAIRNFFSACFDSFTPVILMEKQGQEGWVSIIRHKSKNTHKKIITALNTFSLIENNLVSYINTVCPCILITFKCVL